MTLNGPQKEPQSDFRLTTVETLSFRSGGGGDVRGTLLVLLPLDILLGRGELLIVYVEEKECQKN